jgi:hypothetical protein
LFRGLNNTSYKQNAMKILFRQLGDAHEWALLDATPAGSPAPSKLLGHTSRRVRLLATLLPVWVALVNLSTWYILYSANTAFTLLSL